MSENKGEKKKIDRRIIKTQRAIREAFQHLLIEKGIDKITVSALAREADIDRKTFYLHFRSIDELIQQEANALVERVAGALTTTVHDDDPVFLNMRRVLVELANVVSENETLYQHVISSLSMDQMVNTLFTPVRRAVLESDKGARLAGDPGLDYILRFYIAGTLSVFIEWFMNDREKPIASIVDIVEQATRANEAILNPGKTLPPKRNGRDNAPAGTSNAGGFRHEDRLHQRGRTHRHARFPHSGAPRRAPLATSARRSDVLLLDRDKLLRANHRERIRETTERKRASMTSNSEYTEAYLRIIADLNGDVDGRRAAHAYMKSSTAIVHHRVVDCSYLPRLFNQATYDVMKETAETAHRILCKVIEHYLDDPATVAFSISTRDSPSSSCCRATTTRCCPSHASTRS